MSHLSYFGTNEKKLGLIWKNGKEIIDAPAPVINDAVSKMSKFIIITLRHAGKQKATIE